MTANAPGIVYEELWAILSIDSGEEGVVGVFLPDLGMTPLIAADPIRREQMRKWAKDLKAQIPNSTMYERHFVRDHSQEDVPI